MSPEQLKFTLEALIMATEEPLNLNRLNNLFAEDLDQPSPQAIKDALQQLAEDYQARSLELIEVASGFCFRVRKDFAPWVMKLWELKPARYSRALLETLALIAYKQPITRAEIEEVRGVSVNTHIIKTLLDREWVKVVGHKDVPGKPAILATTKQFLDYFNLKNLAELPPLESLKDLDKAYDQLEIRLQAEANTFADDLDEIRA